MNYNQLLSETRLRPSTSEREKSLVIETESDKARIVFSAPFRRLQKKAQVFPLEQNAAVRSRLTHSLEVATIARQIAQKIVLKVNSLNPEQKDAFINIIESACLLHDIGNPPFGHFGEAAISNWFTEKGKTEFAHHRKEKPDWYEDLEKFEGNAQGLRIITKLQSEDQFGLNLTCSTIAAYLKYTYPEHKRKEALARKMPFSKKNGFFLTEQPQVLKTWDILGLEHHRRHPLTFVMEAADDIAYCLSDIEDGIEKNIISFQELIEHIQKNVNSLCETHRTFWEQVKKHANKDSLPTSQFIALRTFLINKSTSTAADHYAANEADILDGSFSESLLDKSSSEYAILEIIREFVSKNVYTAREAEMLELAGNSAISGILEKLKPILDLPKDSFDALLNEDNKQIKNLGLHTEKRLLHLIPTQCKKCYRSQTLASPHLEWFNRAHLVIDYISGMTDDYALDIYQKLAGIKIA